MGNKVREFFYNNEEKISRICIKSFKLAIIGAFLATWGGGVFFAYHVLIGYITFMALGKVFAINLVAITIYRAIKLVISYFQKFQQIGGIYSYSAIKKWVKKIAIISLLIIMYDIFIVVFIRWLNLGSDSFPYVMHASIIVTFSLNFLISLIPNLSEKIKEKIDLVTLFFPIMYVLRIGIILIFKI